jgi:hypothetical protein
VNDRKTQKVAESQIDENLRRIFEQDVEQELPDRLRALLEDLDRDDDDEGGEGNGGDAGGSAEGGEGGTAAPGRSALAAVADTVPVDHAATTLAAAPLRRAAG